MNGHTFPTLSPALFAAAAAGVPAGVAAGVAAAAGEVDGGGVELLRPVWPPRVSVGALTREALVSRTPNYCLVIELDCSIIRQKRGRENRPPKI